MAANPSLVMRIVAASVAVSNRASRIIRDILKTGNLGIVEKGKNDLQTEADRSAQRFIVTCLHKQFPNVSIFGEEDEPCIPTQRRSSLARLMSNSVLRLPTSLLLGNRAGIIPSQLEPLDKIPSDFMECSLDKDVLTHPCPQYLLEAEEKDVVIWVDPLDGTAEFTQGLLDHVTVLIGIAVQGNAVAGIINQPYFNYQNNGMDLGRCIWGVIGLGSYGFQRETPPQNEVVVTTSRSHSDRLVTEAVEACNPTRIERVGGAGHKVLLLIEGKVHAYVFASKGCKKWDTCAPEAVLHAVGGYLTDLHGIKMDYNSDVQRKNTGGVLATYTKEDHEKFLSLIPDHVKEMMDVSKKAPGFNFKSSQQNDNQSCQVQVSSDQLPSAGLIQTSESDNAASPTPSNGSVGTTSSSLSDSVQKETVTTKL